VIDHVDTYGAWQILPDGGRLWLGRVSRGLITEITLGQPTDGPADFDARTLSWDRAPIRSGALQL
jgi:hypothetical protein